ncbi:MAG TPA: D-alanyl-D-alanine carboxypeptidase, partial [Accumulibacter sp.]|nr:D-alanyl-D-alanine carboxypeptidase [Accumulibacter sp.]
MSSKRGVLLQALRRMCVAIAISASQVTSAVAEAPAPGKLPPTVLSALQEAGIPTSSVGIVVQAVDGGAALLNHNSRQAMNPASAMKLLTTYAALELLGPAHSWRTEALVTGSLKNGRLDGPLYLRGS